MKSEAPLTTRYARRAIEADWLFSGAVLYTPIILWGSPGIGKATPVQRPANHGSN